jgi:hypothetical protein
MSAESQVNTFPARNHDQPFYFIRNKTSLTPRTQRGQFVSIQYVQVLSLGNSTRMNEPWTIIGVFVLGAASGALVSWIAFASRIREIKRVVHLIDLIEAQSKAANPSDGRDERQDGQDHRNRKSA